MSNKKTLEQMSTTEAKRAGITSLADRPNDASRYGDGGLSAEMLKARFDALPNLVREKFNKIAEMLASTDAAKYITLGGEDNALGETLFDFLALFGPRGDGITDKNISDLIETLYQGEGDEGASSRTLKDIVASICARLVALKSFAGKSVGGISIYFEDDGSIGYKATDRDGNSVSLGKLDPIGKGGIGDGAVSFEKLDAELGGRVSRAFAKVRYTASDGKLHFDSADGEELDSIDLPLESIIVSGTFDTSTKDLVFTLVGGGTLRIPFDEYIEAVASDVSRLNAKTDKSFKTVALAGDSTLIFDTHDGTKSTVDLSTVALDGQTRDTIARLEKNDVDHERRISNLEEHISDDYFVTDDSVAYEKAVPARACSSAKLLSLGGMTHRDEETNTLRDSKVTEIKSCGANRFNFKQMHNGNSQSTVIFNIVDNDTFRLISTHDYPKGSWYYRGTIIPIESDVSQLYVKFNAKTFGEVTRGIVNIHLKNASDIQLASFDAIGTGEVSETFNISGYLNGSKGYLEVSIYCSGGEACTTGAGVEYSKVIISLDADVPYVPYREPVSYPIPAEIQVGKGVNGYADTIDFDANKNIQKVREVDMGELYYDYRFSNNRHIFGTNLSAYGIQGQINTNAPINALAEDYRAVSVFDTWVDRDMSYSSSVIGLQRVEFVDNRYTNVADFKAAVTGKKLLFALETPIETDISESLEDFDNIIEVEGGGSLEFVNEYKNPVPSAVKYLLKEESAV